MRRRGLLVMVTMLVVLGLAVPASAGSSVPIKGTLLGDGAPDMSAPGCVGAIWRFNGWGTGRMSHLGKVGYQFTHCTYPDMTAGPGTFTVVAANGDELVIAHQGTFAVVGAGEGFTGEGTWVAVGGTGRFAGATGSGSWTVLGDIPGGDALFDLPDGYMSFDFAGRIAYDASDRSRR